MLGAKADPSIETSTISTPARATGRLPKESASGPTATMETARAAKDAVFNCPRNRHRYVKVSCDLDQERRDHHYGGLCAEDGKGEHEVKPGLVYLFAPSLLRLSVHSIISGSVTVLSANLKPRRFSRCPRAAAWQTRWPPAQRPRQM